MSESNLNGGLAYVVVSGVNGELYIHTKQMLIRHSNCLDYTCENNLNGELSNMLVAFRKTQTLVICANRVV